jgi:hypothetical protein
MVSPNISKKESQSLELSDNTKRLFQVVYTEQNKDIKKSDEESKIRVSALISKMAFYYEKIRNSVDYKEEYLLRKNAIERALKRFIVIEGVIKVSDSLELSKSLLIELIRAGYLPNNSIPEKKIKDIAYILEKYVKLKNYSLARLGLSNSIKKGEVIKTKDLISERNKLTSWIIAMAASEIEGSLGLDRIKETAANNMYDTLINIIKLPKELSEYQKDLEIQIYLGIYRDYLKFDVDMLSFILFKYYNSNWKNAKDEDIAKISQNINLIRKAIDAQLKHPLQKQLHKIIAKYTVYFSILEEMVSEDPVGVYEAVKNDPKAFPRMIKKICAKKYKSIKSKLWRAATRSIIYIFLTKSIFVILLEVPAIKWFGEEINYFTLGINIVFPALLLFIIVLFTKVPTEANTNKIVEGIEELSFKNKEREEPYVLKKPSKRGGMANALFSIFYSITFFLSFGAVIWVLDKLNFNWVSTVIFLFFLAFVSFFSIRIRKSVKEMVVVESADNLVGFVIDFFYVPIVAVGKWLSEKFSRVNVFVFVMDFIIEAPFKILIDIAEDWIKYVKERKDEIV